MRTTSRRPITTSLVLVGAMVLFAGCGDEGAHLPAGMTGSSAAYSGATGVGVLDDVIGGDPGPQTAGVSTMVDDPILAGYDGVDSLDGGGLDDPYAQAANDWSATEGSVSGMGYDDFDDDGMMPVGYGGGSGYGYGYGSGYGYGYGSGYGTGMVGAAAYGGYGGGLMDAGLVDGGFEDPGLIDAGFEDPGFVDPGFDPGIDPGMGATMVDPGFDAAAMDVGAMDIGAVDVGGMDVGMMDVGAVDVGSFDAGIGF